MEYQAESITRGMTDIDKRIAILNRQVAELTSQRNALQNHWTICQYLDKAAVKLQGNTISDNDLRSCGSLVSLVNSADEKFTNFVNQIRKLSLDRLGFLGFAFVKHVSWKSFDADHFDRYMTRKALTVGKNPEIGLKLQSLCIKKGGAFKEIYDAAAQSVMSAASQVVCETDGGVSSQTSNQGWNKRPYEPDGHDLASKRQCSDMKMYTFSYADKDKLWNAWSPEIMQVLKNGRLWGLGRTAGNFQVHNIGSYHEFVMQLDNYLDLSKTKVFKEEREWGEVRLQQVYQLVVRSTDAKASEVRAQVFV